MTIALDGSAAGHHAGTPVTATLTTANTPDVIYLVVLSDTGTNATPTSLHLTFSARQSHGDSGIYQLNTFYAISSGALTNELITATDVTANDMALIVFGISGANTSSPFDGHAGVPASQGSVDAPTEPTVNISTSNANDMIIGIMGCDVNGAGTAGAKGAAYNLILSELGANPFIQLLVEYLVVSSTQTNLAVNATAYSTWSASAMFADAIVAASGAATAPSYRSGSTLGLLGVGALDLRETAIRRRPWV